MGLAEPKALPCGADPARKWDERKRTLFAAVVRSRAALRVVARLHFLAREPVPLFFFATLLVLCMQPTLCQRLELVSCDRLLVNCDDFRVQ
jgi:hypothetical protein